MSFVRSSGLVSYGYVASVGLGARQQGWPDMVVPAVLALTLVALLAVRDGRLRAAAITDRESLLVITYSLVLSWTVQLSWLSPRRPGWILLAAAPPADLPY